MNGSSRRREATRSGWNPGKVAPAQGEAGGRRLMHYLITDGFDDEREAEYHGAPYTVYDLLRGPAGLDLGRLRAEFGERYAWPPSDVEDWDHVALDTQQNYLLRTIETMRADGYTDDELAGPLWAWPRPATLFSAWLKREKGFVHEHVHDVNFGDDRLVMSEAVEKDVLALRRDHKARGWEPMQPVYEGP